MFLFFFNLCVLQSCKLDIDDFRPNPSLDEIEESCHEFCTIDWEHAQQNMLGEEKKHRYTRDDQFAYRCFEGLYMSTLLEDGFGFNGTKRDITLALEVAGSEVEWTLGFALAEGPYPTNHTTTLIIKNHQENSVTKFIGGTFKALKNIVSYLLSIPIIFFKHFANMVFVNS